MKKGGAEEPKSAVGYGSQRRKTPHTRRSLGSYAKAIARLVTLQKCVCLIVRPDCQPGAERMSSEVVGP